MEPIFSPSPLNLAALPSRLAHLRCLQVGPKVSPAPLEAMCSMWLAETHSQMLHISSRPSYKSVWGKVCVNWLLLWKREFTFLSFCQWTCGWFFFQNVYFFLIFGIQAHSALIIFDESCISYAIEVEMDSMYGIHWRCLRIAPSYVFDYQLTKWRD